MHLFRQLLSLKCCVALTLSRCKNHERNLHLMQNQFIFPYKCVRADQSCQKNFRSVISGNTGYDARPFYTHFRKLGHNLCIHTYTYFANQEYDIQVHASWVIYDGPQREAISYFLKFLICACTTYYVSIFPTKTYYSQRCKLSQIST